MPRSIERFAWIAVLTAATGCHVYNSDLLRRDGSVDQSDITVPQEGGDAPADRQADTGDQDVQPGDVADAQDVQPDAGPSCTALLAAGTACLEPYSGQAFGADEPRLVAPLPVAASADANPLIVVGDLGTGRVMSYVADGTMPRRLAGTGLLSAPSADGVATDTPLVSPAALLFLPSGDVLIGDSVVHTLYILRRSVNRLERFGTLSFQDGPSALALLDINTLLVAADNKVYSVNITTGLPSSPTSLLGCGLSCRGFNATPTSGDLTRFDGPTGVDADASYIYVADSQNCRIRRTLRSSPTLNTTVFAGGGCDRSSDILGGSGGTIAAAMAHLGPVGDVRVGSDGTVYFTDPEAHCAILAVSVGTNLLRVIAGSSAGCGVVGPGGATLGRLGGLGISEDRNTLFFVDAQNHRIGNIQLNAAGGPAFRGFGIAPGVIPSTTDTRSQLRAGAVSGLAATGTEADPTVYWAGQFEQRVYRQNATTLSVYAGNGRARLVPPIPAASLEPSVFSGLGFGEGKLLLPLTSHAAVAYAMGTAVFRIAGTYDTPGDPTGVMATNDTLSAPSFPIVHASNLYFSAQGPSRRVYRLDGVSGMSVLTPVAGVPAGADGGVPGVDAGIPATSATLGRPAGLAFDLAENLYVADPTNHVVWRVAGGSIDIIAGLYRQITPLDDTPNDALGVAIPDPEALAFDGAHTLYVADRRTHRIRAIDLTTHRMQTVAGAGSVAADYIDPSTSTIGEVSSLAMLGNRLYFGEWDTGRVRVLRFAP